MILPCELHRATPAPIDQRMHTQEHSPYFEAQASDAYPGMALEITGYMASQPDISAILQREIEAGPGSFLAGVRFDLHWDQTKFTELCAALHSAAKEHAGQKNLPRDLSQLFWYCGTFVPLWIEQSDFRIGQSQVDYGKAVSLLRRLGNKWFGDERSVPDGEISASPAAI